MTAPLQCLEESKDCRGLFHAAKRQVEQERIDRRYAPDSDVPPRGFDPYAGERWDDDY